MRKTNGGVVLCSTDGSYLNHLKRIFILLKAFLKKTIFCAAYKIMPTIVLAYGQKLTKKHGFSTNVILQAGTNMILHSTS